MKTLRLHSDGGGVSPNLVFAYYAILDPGPTQRFVTAEGFRLGAGTSNEAEYAGIITALNSAPKLIHDTSVDRIEMISDSQLIVNQINGIWRTKEPRLKVLCEETRESIAALTSPRRGRPIPVAIKWKRRKHNRAADLICRVTSEDRGIGHFISAQDGKPKGAARQGLIALGVGRRQIISDELICAVSRKIDIQRLPGITTTDRSL